MKKLFFSAVFLIAFSSVSMANTIADKEIITNANQVVVVDLDNCQILAANALVEVDPNNYLSDIQAHDLLQSFYGACMAVKDLFFG